MSEENLPEVLEPEKAGLRIPKPLVPMKRLNEITAAYNKYVMPPKITDAGARAAVSHELIAIVTQKNWAVTTLKTLTDPVRALEKQLRDLFKVPVQLLEGIETKLRSSIALYDNEERSKIEAQRRRQQAELEAAAKKEKDELAQQAIEAELEGKPHVAQMLEKKIETVSAPLVGVVEYKPNDGTSSRMVQKWRIVNEKLIPRPWWMLDESKITRACNAKLPPPPGIEFYEEPAVVVRPNSMR
jgi:hypothetical protein